MRKATPWLGGTIGEAATGAARTKTFLASRYKRIVRRRSKQRALVAVGNSISPSPGTCYPTPPPLHRPGPRLARPPCPATPQATAHRRASAQVAAVAAACQEPQPQLDYRPGNRG